MSAHARRSVTRRLGLRVPRWLSHRGLIALEAVLLVGILRDVLTRNVMGAAFPSYGKVLLVMGMTVGVFGGLFLFIEHVTARTVAGTHKAVRSLTGVLPYWALHAGILFLLFLLYANMLGLRVF